MSTNKKTIADALACLRPLDQEIITLRHFDELSNAAAAATLGVTPVAAGKLYIRAMKRLTDQIHKISQPTFEPFAAATTVVYSSHFAALQAS